MIRILHSVSYMSRGGIETMLMNYYRHIDRNKVQFDFLCHSYNKGAYDEEIVKLGGRIFRTPGLNPLKFGKYRKYMKELFASHPEYRIVESHNGPFGIYPLYAAKENNIPIRIYHAHGAGIEFDIKYPLKITCKSLLKYNMNRHFICGIKAGYFYMGKTVMETGNYKFIPNAIDLDKFIYNEEVRNKLRSKYGLERKLVVGHVGRISYEKNHRYLIKVFAKALESNPDLYLVLLGDGALASKVKAQIKQLGIENHVLMLGVVSNTNEWYQAFDLFVLPSIREGLPVVGIEAQAADLPCIFSTAVTEEVALTEKTTFIDLKEPVEVWANKINEVLNKKEYRNNNYDLLTEKGYNIKTEAKKLQELYISIYNDVKQQ